MKHREKQVVWGISCSHHDAALAAVQDGEILFAGHSERYSGRKNDPNICEGLVRDCLNYSPAPDKIIYYEKTAAVKYRQILAGQLKEFVASPWRVAPRLRIMDELKHVRIYSAAHHKSHACGGYFTSRFEDAAIIVADAVGENETLTVWAAKGRRLKKVLSIKYPHSLGLFYSSFTDRLGLRPNEEEFIMMALAAFGKPTYRDQIINEFVYRPEEHLFRLKRNMHRGIRDWRDNISDYANVASSVQAITEETLAKVFRWAAEYVKSRNVVFSGGIALNCVANTKIARQGYFDNCWIMPNPGDAGSSLGAILAHTRDWVRWAGPYLGHDINRDIDISGAVEALLRDEIIAVAHGRAEFGPRALGNRSLLADSRKRINKDRMNEVKRREPFRPFAPIVMYEYAEEYFDLHGREVAYMQYAVMCKRPEEIPAVCHVDGTSRVQTLRREQNPKVYDLLDAFRMRTGCPVLMNTSLNVKGKPIVNSWDDAVEFSRVTGIKVF